MKIRFEFLALVLIVAIIAIVGQQFNVYHFAQTQQSAVADIGSFSAALKWVEAGGYVLMFVGMVIEGPVITAAAAFAAALGYFNVWIVLGLAVAGDLIADFAYYGIGYFGRVAMVEKYGGKVGITKERMEKLEHLIKTHPKKTMVAIKLAPLLPTPGLMMVGATRMPFREYATIAFVITLPKAIIFMALGYFFGHAYDGISHYLENGEYFILIALVFVVGAYYAYKTIAAKISMRLEAI